MLLVLITFYTTKNYYKKDYDFSFKKDVKVKPKVLSKEEKRHLKYLSSSLDQLHQIKGNSIPGEWLAEHKETGQTYLEYKNCNPISKSEERFKLYIQPIGSFTSEGKSIIILTADYLSKFYNVPIEILDSISTDIIPSDNRRDNDGIHQLNAKYILDSVLEPKIPSDGAAYLAFSSIDLYPSEKRNFVFGLGSTNKRVGVCSFYRYGDPSLSKGQFKKCLLRTIKVASHEMGHMFSIKHCIEYECLMSGSNSLGESDTKPIYLCPTDLMKVSQITGLEEKYRFEMLEKFWTNTGFEEEAKYYNNAIKLLKSNLERR